MIYYITPSTNKVVAVTNDVMSHLNLQHQRGVKSKEAGGQLFAQFDGNMIIVSKVTGPRKSDKRGRFFFNPDRNIEQREINRMFLKGIHYVGDWHTHPERVPTPSRKDITSMSECVSHSTHELDSFILMIVGQDNLPDGLWVSLHGATDFEQLHLLK